VSASSGLGVCAALVGTLAAILGDASSSLSCSALVVNASFQPWRGISWKGEIVLCLLLPLIHLRSLWSAGIVRLILLIAFLFAAVCALISGASFVCLDFRCPQFI
jgi:hypothetical protein